jgi:hypothetical protein
MAAIEFLEGNRRKITVTFTVPDVAGVPTDQDTVTFYVRHLKTGTLETIPQSDARVSHDGVGIYSLTYDFLADGQYVVGAEGSTVASGPAYVEADVHVVNARAKG